MERHGNVYLNLFEQGSGQLRLPSGNVVQLNMEGDFLEAEPLRLHISVDHSEAFELAIRNPRWSRHTMVEMNGRPLPVDESQDWIRIRRSWSGGDMVTIFLEPGIRYEFFDTSKFQTRYHPIEFYNKQWAGLQFLGGSNQANNQRYGHVTRLPLSAALPSRPAVAMLYGPMVLSRDVRISGPDVFSPMALPADPGSIKVSRIQPPPNIRHAFELDLGEGQIIRCCDFSSAGNTWSNESLFNTWCMPDTDE